MFHATVKRVFKDGIKVHITKTPTLSEEFDKSFFETIFFDKTLKPFHKSKFYVGDMDFYIKFGSPE